MGYVGICGPKGCGFSAVLVRSRVPILARLISNRVCFRTLVLNSVCFLEEAVISPLLIRPSTKALYNDFDIGLHWGANYKPVLKQGLGFNRVSRFWSGHK